MVDTDLEATPVNGEVGPWVLSVRGQPVAAPEPVAPESLITVVREGPQYEAFRPDLWATLDEARQALRARVVREHEARTRARAISLESALRLAKIYPRTAAEEIELEQHARWANEARNADDVRNRKMGEIAALATLPEARAYATTVDDGWSE